MRLEVPRRSRHLLNLTPLIDVVFLLLVFFMLTAHFVSEQAIPVELPKARSGASLEQVDNITVALGAGGGITVSGRSVAVTELEAVLHEALQPLESKRVVIRGDSGAQLGVTVAVLDAARKAGAERVDIETEQP
jgi:biopolymer transport protein ExbD